MSETPPSSNQKSDGAEMTPIAPPGHWCWDIDPTPVVQAVKLLSKSHKWTGHLAEEYDCPVFKAEPGWKAVLVTDHKAATQIFNSPAEDFDRDDGFLVISLDYQRMLRNVCPAVMIRDSDIHTKTRQFMVQVFRTRGLDDLYTICSDVIRNGLPHFRDQPSFFIADAFAEVGAHIMFKWLLDLDGYSGSQVQQWNIDMGYTRGQSFISNLILSQFKKRPDQNAVDRSNEYQQFIESSPYYSQYQQFANEIGISDSNIAPNLLFACMANATSPCYVVGQPGIAKLYTMPDLRARVEAEVRDVYDAREIDDLPLLDAFFYESARWFGKPDRTARQARRDLTVTIGDGRVIELKKGMSVHIIHTRIRADPLVFKDPDTFNPDRFIDDPSLKEKLFLFGATEGRDKPKSFSCPGALGAAVIWKAAVLTCLRDPGAKIEPEYTIDMDSGKNRTNPKDLTWIRSTQ